MIFMTKNTTVFTDPFHIAILATVKICYFLFLPLVGEAIGVYFDWNALDF